MHTRAKRKAIGDPTQGPAGRVVEGARWLLKKLMKEGEAEETSTSSTSASTSAAGLVRGTGGLGIMPNPRIHVPAGERRLRRVPSVIMEDGEDPPSTNRPPSDPDVVIMDASDQDVDSGTTRPSEVRRPGGILKASAGPSDRSSSAPPPSHPSWEEALGDSRGLASSSAARAR